MTSLILLFTLSAVQAAPHPQLLDSPGCRTIDAERSQVRFSVEQADSTLDGQFETFDGVVCMGGERVTRIEVRLLPASVDTGIAEIDAALQGEDYFAVEDYPQATFASESVTATDGGFRASGVLRIRGVEREQVVPFQLRRGDEGDRLQGAFTLNRKVFGVGTGEWADTFGVGEAVTVMFDVLVPARAGDEE